MRIEQNLPARSRKRDEALIPRVGKGLPGFRIERAPSREGVSALDHQATPAALSSLCYMSIGFHYSRMDVNQNVSRVPKERRKGITEASPSLFPKIYIYIFSLPQLTNAHDVAHDRLGEAGLE